MKHRLYRNWWLMMLKAVFIIILGLAFIISPREMATTFLWGTGILIMAGGLALIIGAFSHRRYNYEWTWWLLEGLIDVLAALLILLRPGETAVFLTILMGVWVILMGFISLATAINIQYYLGGNLVFVLTGILLLASGGYFLFFPHQGLKALISLIGIAILCYGLLMVYISVLMKKLIVEEIGEIEDLY